MEISLDTILKVYNCDKNAFVVGCGKDTMVYKFRTVTGTYYNKRLLRKEICKYFNPIYAKNKCTRFDI